MLVNVEFTATLLSRKETEYKFEDGKTVTGYKLGIMCGDECGMIKCTAECLPDDVEFFAEHIFTGSLNTERGTFRITSVVPV